MLHEYDDENHVYKIDGVIVPSITQLLPKQDFYVSDARLAELSEEGRDNHSMIKMFFDTKDTCNDPMLTALSDFVENEAHFGELICCEKGLFSEKLMFGGTPDAIFENAIIEFKRSFGKRQYHALQIAGQQILAVENGLMNKTRKWIVAWYDGGKFKKKNVYNDRAEIIFRSLLKKHYIDQAVTDYLES